MNESNHGIRIVPGREVRVIPAGWQHPLDSAGRLVPLFPSQMPSVDGLTVTEIVAYETTSEGTPISPAFPNTLAGRLDLVRYCAEHRTTFGSFKADAEAWAAILFGEGATVSEDGIVEAS